MNSLRYFVASGPWSAAHRQPDRRTAFQSKTLTEGHHREKVVNDVEVGDIVQEEAPLPAEEITIYSRRSAPLEVPLSVAVVREFDVRVVKVSDHDEPSRLINLII